MDAGEANAHQRGGGDAPEDHLEALVLRKSGGGEPDDDRVVACEHQVDHDDLEQGGQGFAGEVSGHSWSLS
jgi:hypothetical protein